MKGIVSLVAATGPRAGERECVTYDCCWYRGQVKEIVWLVAAPGTQVRWKGLCHWWLLLGPIAPGIQVRWKGLFRWWLLLGPRSGEKDCLTCGCCWDPVQVKGIVSLVAAAGTQVRWKGLSDNGCCWDPCQIVEKLSTVQRRWTQTLWAVSVGFVWKFWPRNSQPPVYSAIQWKSSVVSLHLSQQSVLGACVMISWCIWNPLGGGM